MTKTTLTALAALVAALVVPAAASAQSLGAAGTLPNTFDRPASAAPAPAAPSPAAPPQAVPAAPSDPAKVAAAETALKATIAAFQSGTPNYGAMTPDVAAKIREQAATVTPVIQGFGTLNGLSHVGSQNGAELFLVMFANAPTQWIIGLTPEGKIEALRFREAPATPPT